MPKPFAPKKQTFFTEVGEKVLNIFRLRNNYENAKVEQNINDPSKATHIIAFHQSSQPKSLCLSKKFFAGSARIPAGWTRERSKSPGGNSS